MFSTLGYTDGCNCCSNSEIDVFSSNSTSAQICDGEEGTHVPCLCENGENKVSAGLSEQTRICTQIYRDTSVHRYHTYGPTQSCLCIVYVQTVTHSSSISILQCGTRYTHSGSNSNCYLDTDGDKIPDVKVGCEQEDPTAMCMSCVSQLRVACT